MQINVKFTVNPKNSDPGEVFAAFDQYLRDMLYVGTDDDPDDPFNVDEVYVIWEPPVSPVVPEV